MGDGEAWGSSSLPPSGSWDGGEGAWRQDSERSGLFPEAAGSIFSKALRETLKTQDPVCPCPAQPGPKVMTQGLCVSQGLQMILEKLAITQNMGE